MHCIFDQYSFCAMVRFATRDAWSGFSTPRNCLRVIAELCNSNSVVSYLRNWDNKNFIDDYTVTRKNTKGDHGIIPFPNVSTAPCTKYSTRWVFSALCESTIFHDTRTTSFQTCTLEVTDGFSSLHGLQRWQIWLCPLELLKRYSNLQANREYFWPQKTLLILRVLSKQNSEGVQTSTK